METKEIVTFLVSLFVWCTSAYFGFGAVGFTGIVLYFIFTHLGTKKPGELSAYSVFNPKGVKLPGTFDAEQIDGNYRGIKPTHKPLSPTNDFEEDNQEFVGGVMKSKYANSLCPCNSGKKLKKCCRGLYS